MQEGKAWHFAESVCVFLRSGGWRLKEVVDQAVEEPGGVVFFIKTEGHIKGQRVFFIYLFILVLKGLQGWNSFVRILRVISKNAPCSHAL